MALDKSVIGSVVVAAQRSWEPAESCLYALGVGAGSDDPLTDLGYTTDNTTDTEHRVLPSFAVVLSAVPGQSPLNRIGNYDKGMLVHGEQSFALSRPLPAAGRAAVETRVLGIWEKGSGALVATETVATLHEDGHESPLFQARASYFVRGERGFGRQRQVDPWAIPERAPDQVIRAGTRPDQALLYRLTGDRNPLHSDPAVAARAGYDRPILQGLCTFGFVARGIGRSVGGADRVVGMAGRFSRPVLPGAELVTRLWADGEDIRYQTFVDCEVVLDRGRAVLGAPVEDSA